MWMKSFFFMLALYGCNVRAAVVNLQFWHSMTGEKGKLISELANDFNKLPENQGKQQVTPQFVGTYEDGLNKVITSLMVKRGPHVAQITDIGTQIMIDSGAVTPLQDFIKDDPDFPL